MKFFNNNFYNFEALRAVCPNIHSTFDEIQKITKPINEGDEESWCEHWYKAALEALANKEWLKACNYFRTAAFMFADGEKRTLDIIEESREAFREGMKEEPYFIQSCSIPYENTALPGYLCLASDDGKKRPTIILHSGFDGTAEEVYITTAQYALQRGYNVLIFEGPGQGAARRQLGLTFRPDWEAVVSPMVDFALQQPQIDGKNLILYGISMGGYLAPRALAFEHRISLGIANGGVFDFHAVFMSTSPVHLELMLDIPHYQSGINHALEENMKRAPEVRWSIKNAMYVFGAKMPADVLRMTRPYQLRDCVKQIKAAMLVIDGEHDVQFKDQALALYASLQSPKEYLLFKGKEGAHCQAGAYETANKQILDWLDKQLMRPISYR